MKYVPANFTLNYVTYVPTSDIGTRIDTLSKHTEFGCKFLNDQYETIKTRTPIWGEKPSGRICITDSSENNQTSTKNEQENESVPKQTRGAPKDNNVNIKTTNKQTVLYTEWNQFKLELRQSFVETIENNHSLNDVSPFIR
uniref:Uncharacterized protein n=1 Tax=Cacopsylla melanoneura TaxID=428564 RepID=A0A8D8X6Y3_9HEMI